MEFEIEFAIDADLLKKDICVWLEKAKRELGEKKAVALTEFNKRVADSEREWREKNPNKGAACPDIDAYKNIHRYEMMKEGYTF